MQCFVEKSQYFTDKSYLFYFKCSKNWKCSEIQIQTFRVAVMTVAVADDGHIRLLVVFFTDYDLLLKYPVKVPQICFKNYLQYVA